MIEPGMTYTAETVVNDDLCACSMGSGNLPVFATPAMVALMENAAMNAVASHLPEGATTVGCGIDISHTRPSGRGRCIKATATLIAVDGRKLTFAVTACDIDGEIGRGTHVRVVVDSNRFMSKVAE